MGTKATQTKSRTQKPLINIARLRPSADAYEHFGQTGTIGELYRHFGIDSRSIYERALSLTPGRPIASPAFLAI